MPVALEVQLREQENVRLVVDDENRGHRSSDRRCPLDGDARDPRLRVPDLRQSREQFWSLKCPVQQLGPAFRLDRRDELLALLVLVDLRLEAEQALQQFGKRVALLPPLP